MKLTCLASGSSGNCYLLETETECLILDAGIPIKKIKKALNYDISKVVGVFCSHSHKDHSLAVEDFKRMGIYVFEPYRQCSQKAQLGDFKLCAFSLPHDGTENRGVLVEHTEMGKLLYMTDMEYSPYSFKNQKVNHMIIEANHEKSFLQHDSNKYTHQIRGHMSIETCCNFVKKSKTNNLTNVVMCHLSCDCSDEDLFLEKMKSVFSGNVYIAKKGLNINISEVPF